DVAATPRNQISEGDGDGQIRDSDECIGNHMCPNQRRVSEIAVRVRQEIRGEQCPSQTGAYCEYAGNKKECREQQLYLASKRTRCAKELRAHDWGRHETSGLAFEFRVGKQVLGPQVSLNGHWNGHCSRRGETLDRPRSR